LKARRQDVELYPLPDARKVKMLRKLALYWDGQWFLHAVQKFGLDEAIELNALVRTAFGRIEMRTMLQALGKKQADDLPDAIRMVATHTDLLLGPAAKADYQIEGSSARILVRRCSPYEGAKKANLPREDQACVTCETLWDAWFAILMPGSSITVQYPQRQGKGDPVCEFLIEEKRKIL
jgi:ABC-type uncharacterized transport system permease subunit